MKAIAILFSLCSLNAFAAPSSQTVQIATVVNVNNLACVQPAGREIYTDLRAGSERASIFLLGQDESKVIQLVHNEATGADCDINKLNKLEKASRLGFGFLYNVPTTVENKLDASFRDGSGACVANLSETVTIDFGDGVVLHSGLIEEIPATDCSNP